MAEFLSQEWIADLQSAAELAVAPEDLRLTVQQVVTGGEEEVAYAVCLDAGRIRVVAGRVPGADVTFTQDRSTAAAVARGDLPAQVAFLTGRLRVGGDLAGTLGAARALTGIGDVFAAARSATTW